MVNSKTSKPKSYIGCSLAYTTGGVILGSGAGEVRESICLQWVNSCSAHKLPAKAET